MNKIELYLGHEYRALKNKCRNYWKRSKKDIIIGGFTIIIAFAAALQIVNAREERVDKKIAQTQKDLAKEVFRFHILANSDSKEDQELKMKVKEAVLDYMADKLPNSASVSETKAWANENINKIESLSEELIKSQGYDYKVSAKVTKCDFPDKTYGDVTFPAGRYEALRIEIGKAGGHNWWCVLYPNLCFIDAANAVVPDEGKEDLKKVLTDDEYEMVTATTKFKIKWFFFDKD